MNRDIAVLREVIVKLTQMLAGMGLRVTQQGSMAYVESDPKTNKPVRVNIPYLPDNASEALVLAIQGFIDHEVAHILFTDWNAVKKAYAAGSKLGILHNIVEDPFIERAIGKKFPGSVHNLAQLHDFFIKSITTPALAKAKTPMDQFGVLLVPICRAWSGQKVFKNWLDANKHWDHPVVKAFTDKIKPATIDRMPKLENSWQTLEVAEEFFAAIHPPKTESEEDGEAGETGSEKKLSKPSKKPTKADKGEGEGEHEEKTEKAEDSLEMPPEASETPESEGDEAGDGGDEAGSGSDGAKPKKPSKSKKSEASDETEEDDGAGEDSDGDSESKGAGDEFDPHDPGEEIITERFDEDSDGESSAKDKRGEDGEAEDGDGEGGNPAERSTSGAESEAGGDPFQSATPETSSFEDALTKMITDETTRQTKDADYAIFTKDFDTIEKHKVSDRYQDAWLINLDEKTRHMVGVMQKDVERMMAQRSQVVNVPGYRSGRLHSSGLHRLTVNDDRVFRRKQEAHSTDTAVCLLVDNSGSMSGRKTEVAMSAAFALSSTLDRVKIAHECIGFTTGYGGFGRAPAGYNWGVIRAEEQRLKRSFSRTEPVYMPIYKGFEERLTPAVKKRFADVVGHQNFLANNIDGEAVETATQRLLKRKEKRRVLIVLSDGFPACSGNAAEIYSHLHKAIADATKLKVEVIGIGIHSNAVRTFYPKNVVLDDLDKLPTTVMGEIKRILTAA